VTHSRNQHDRVRKNQQHPVVGGIKYGCGIGIESDRRQELELFRINRVTEKLRRPVLDGEELPGLAAGQIRSRDLGRARQRRRERNYAAPVPSVR
jgi:hypothetical protein